MPENNEHQLTVAELIGELVRIGNMDAPVWIDGIVAHGRERRPGARGDPAGQRSWNHR